MDPRSGPIMAGDGFHHVSPSSGLKLTLWIPVSWETSYPSCLETTPHFSAATYVGARNENRHLDQVSRMIRSPALFLNSVFY